MRAAIENAKKATYPFGAVIVKGGEIIAHGISGEVLVSNNELNKYADNVIELEGAILKEEFLEKL